MDAKRRNLTFAALICFLLTAGLPATEAASGADGEARGALKRAEAILFGARGGLGEARSMVAGRSATLALRDLAAVARTLSGDEARRARALLARPTQAMADPAGFGYLTDSEVACSSRLCVHWVETTSDAPPLEDVDKDGLPDWVEVTGGVLGRVWTELSGAGYRPPRSDESSSDPGPDGRLDVYLADTGALGIYGYCATDDPELTVRYDVSSYCVLDNDFAANQLFANPVDSLRVTAAHELFHAVQFGYDYLEDSWLMEGTAAWMEDEVYDGINDNWQYFSRSPLTKPRRPADLGAAGHQYGAWVFWRFMAEYFGARSGGDPDVIRRVWELADGASGAPDLHSLAAVRAVSVDEGTSFEKVFADFTALASRFHEVAGEHGA